MPIHLHQIPLHPLHDHGLIKAIMPKTCPQVTITAQRTNERVLLLQIVINTLSLQHSKDITLCHAHSLASNSSTSLT